MENGTAQAEDKRGHASDRIVYVGDEASGVEGYKRMEARTRSPGFGKRFVVRHDWRSSGYLARDGCRIHGSLRSADRAEPH